MTDRPLVSPGESTRVKLAVISASFVASSTSSHLTTLAQRSTQAPDMAPSCSPTSSNASLSNSAGMQYAERADGRALLLNLDKIHRELHRHG